MPETLIRRIHTEPLSEIILRERKARGWKQRRLAQKSGISTYTISQVENGRVEPELHTITCLLNALGFELTLGVRRTDESQTATLFAYEVGRRRLNKMQVYEEAYESNKKLVETI